MEQNEEMVAEQKAPNRRDKYTILYVDDEESNLRIFRMAFKREYNVLTAMGGNEAIEMLRTNDIQCLITDQKMPEMTGTELLERVLPEFPDVIRMILTGFADIEAIVKAVNKCGIYKYITKPWDKGEMKLTIDKALEAYELKSDKINLIRELEKANSSLEEKVETRTKELAEVNKRLMDSIKYAMTIQNAMLVSPELIKEAFSDFFLIFKPLDIVSGDFYWIAEIENEDGDAVTCIACVDCTGHGVAGALMSMIGESLLNQIVHEHEITDVDEILENLNIGIIEILNQSENENHHGMDASILVIDRAKSQVHFAGAKQNLLYTKDGKIETIKGERISIGGFVDEERGYKKHVVDFEEGETSFYMFSDGFPDQFGGPGNKKFSAARLTECLEQNMDKPMDEQKAILEKTLTDWIGDEKQTDDIMIMGIRI
ncbi:response regulator [Reichenbachiella agarivorans]|uniref:Response regulator n=1 Tax=Reichenbachiella agarivorans TaxID=2979464 RepID=A0ABY6CN80_9BACT|nr:response regulator [Reichenbachiella agarivorans]UXP31976.1 response regulator [Reichenbachiella agarivorans]